MSDDSDVPDEVWEQLDNTIETDDVDEFERLIRLHPACLRDEDGIERWLRIVAAEGRLPFVRRLAELGIDVNEPTDFDFNPENPFYQPEGAILHAAGEGHLDVVRWLLDHGAQINYVVRGKPRCWPLVDAATNGHLDVVKLLVEYGADVHSTWRGINAVSQAEDYGEKDVVDYLRSVGAKTLRETTPPDYESGRKRFLKEQAEQVGELSDWTLEIPGDPLVTLRFIPANEKVDRHTLLTVGLSDHRLPNGWRQHSCTELRCILPPDWPPPEESQDDPAWNWPIEGLRILVEQLRDAEQWPEPAIFMNGDPPTPVGPGTTMNGWIALQSPESTQAPDYRWIDMHSVFPIYAEEAELVREQGHEELVNRFEARNIPLYIDPQRPNVATE